MEPLSRLRRAGLAAAAASLAGLVPLRGEALEAPVGKVILVVSGAIAQRNSPDGASFDLAGLARLPATSFVTRTPWYSEPRRFTGVLLRELLDAVGAHGTTLTATALNDYRAQIPLADVATEDLLLAYHLDGDEMAVRDKGPLVLIYPFDAKKSLRTAVYYSRAVWQLHHLDLR